MRSIGKISYCLHGVNSYYGITETGDRNVIFERICGKNRRSCRNSEKEYRFRRQKPEKTGHKIVLNSVLITYRYTVKSRIAEKTIKKEKIQ